MGFFGGSPKTSMPTPPPEPPKIDDAAVQAAAEEQRKRGNSGRASTIFTDPLAAEDSKQSSAKKFLGA